MELDNDVCENQCLLVAEVTGTSEVKTLCEEQAECKLLMRAESGREIGLYLAFPLCREVRHSEHRAPQTQGKLAQRDTLGPTVRTHEQTRGSLMGSCQKVSQVVVVKAT